MASLSNLSTLSMSDVDNAVSIINPVVLKILMAFIVLLLGFAVGKIVEKLLLKFFELIEFNKFAGRFLKLKFSISKMLARIIAYFIYILSIVMALNRLEITTTIITTIVILLSIILILFLIFGTNDLFANVFAGLIIKFRNNIKVGDYVKIKDKRIQGHVISISMLNVRLETGKDELVFVPNMALFKSEVVKIKMNGNTISAKSRKRV